MGRKGRSSSPGIPGVHSERLQLLRETSSRYARHPNSNTIPTSYTFAPAGFLADYISHTHTIPRTSCLILSSLFGIVAQAMLTRVEAVEGLWKVSAVLGVSYGTTFALFPALVLERFGIGECPFILGLDWG